MKNLQSQRPNKNTDAKRNTPRPEIRDNLDSRENEEQQLKGDDTTHNKKAHHNKPKRKNSKTKH